jgi:hypothetical protein
VRTKPVPSGQRAVPSGTLAGFGVETSSHKFGLFQHTCVAFEVHRCRHCDLRRRGRR